MKKLLFIILTTLSLTTYGQDKYNYVIIPDQIEPPIPGQTEPGIPDEIEPLILG